MSSTTIAIESLTVSGNALLEIAGKVDNGVMTLDAIGEDCIKTYAAYSDTEGVRESARVAFEVARQLESVSDELTYQIHLYNKVKMILDLAWQVGFVLFFEGNQPGILEKAETTRSARQTPSREFYLINSEQKSGVVGCFYRGGEARKGVGTSHQASTYHP